MPDEAKPCFSSRIPYSHSSSRLVLATRAATSASSPIRGQRGSSLEGASSCGYASAGTSPGAPRRRSATPNGDAIEIEMRDPGELLSLSGQRTVAEGIGAWNPVFDVTPAALIDAIVTERGVVLQPDVESMRAMFGAQT